MNLRKHITTLAATATLAGLATLGLTVPAQAAEAGPAAAASAGESVSEPTGDAAATADAATPFSRTAGTAAAPRCAGPDLWKPYPRKIGRDWYVEAGARLHDCGLTFLTLELQKNGHTVDKKTVTRQGDINPRYKCRNFKTGKWTIVATWSKPKSTYPGFEVIQKWVSRSPEHLNCS
ncbi:hypothetical protein [Kitasatospora aureofaciens]|uniref:hypothetical protein n=1 Tax=Kitasatospora aureofaciens TaxID=1894 RepID=UPI001C4501AC|nr:hypothetical protein [Kitasatospora aureofaciens]MBV6699827.1 hypothetical protein [Kitasatospora aureofaciens]